jgi:hypothetical protein
MAARSCPEHLHVEKVIYLLWRPAGADAEAWGQALRERLPPSLRAQQVTAARLNLGDAAVAAAEALRQRRMDTQPQALLQVWVDSANDPLRAPLDAEVARHADRYAAYLVTESVPLRNNAHPPRIGTRTAGFAQIALLQRPPRLDADAWRRHWQTVQTPVAVATQSTFEYVQNTIVRALTDKAPPLDAIVEECFPAEAMTDPQVFFDAPGDEAKFQRNLARMMDSVNRFLDLPIDCVPTSQYRLI